MTIDLNLIGTVSIGSSIDGGVNTVTYFLVTISAIIVESDLDWFFEKHLGGRTNVDIDLTSFKAD